MIMDTFFPGWEPTPMQIEWLQTLVRKLNLNGEWGVPHCGNVWKKTAKNELTLVAIATSEPDEVFMNIEWTVRTGKAAGIKVNVEETVEVAMLDLGSKMDAQERFTLLQSMGFLGGFGSASYGGHNPYKPTR